MPARGETEMDAKGQPIGRRVCAVLEYSPADVELLRPLFELGRRYHAARGSLEAAMAAAAAAVTRVERADAGGKLWRHAAQGLLRAADDLDASARILEAMGHRSLTLALEEATSAAGSVLRVGAGPWRAAQHRVDVAKTDVEYDLVLATLPWGQFAFNGWSWAGAGRSWEDAWCARAMLFGFDVYSDRAIGEAAGVSAEAARKRRSRSPWWSAPDGWDDPDVTGHFGARRLSDS